jgi:glycosyltransferase involved in cell wall biosynthesis
MKNLKKMDKIKILHTGTLDVNAGGPAMSTYYTLWGLLQQGVEAELLMYPLSEGGRLRGDQVKIHFAKAPWEHKLAFSPTLKKEIKNAGSFDIYHAQGVWQYPTYALADVAKKLGKPYVITPRGMLYPQDIAKSSTKFKELSLKLRLLKDLNQAACVQVTCDEEMLHCRNLGVISPIAVIPNPIEIRVYEEKKQDDIFRLGYLGRISPRKNVEGLLYAWANLKEKVNNAELLIIGGGDATYEAFLKNEVKRLGLQNVKFTGFLSGKEKDDVIASLSVLAMPSEFENFGNVILEGLIRKIPCIATKGAPWQELETQHCGWWVDYSQEGITSAIEKALNTSKEELTVMGENGRTLLEKNYTVEAVATKMKSLYEWILKKSNKPEFVYL